MYHPNHAQAMLIKIVDTWVAMLRVILEKFEVNASIKIDLNKGDMDNLTNVPGENIPGEEWKTKAQFIADWREKKQFHDYIKSLKRKDKKKDSEEKN